MKGTQIITEDNINNSKIEKNNLSAQNKININQQNIQSTSSKISNIRENKSNKNEKPKNPKKDVFHKQRKSVNYMNTFHFKKKSLIINTNEIKVEKSKDDTNKLKNRKQNKDDIILLAGKGHENYQIIGEEKIPFSEKDIIKGLE
jgi:hypothetical protein